MSDEAALLNAIIAHPDEDTPRLAYADWLDEHGDPVRAEFIRVQCRLAEITPGAPDWIDLHERQEELVARLTHRPLFSWLSKEGIYFGISVPKRFSVGSSVIDRNNEPFRRGFPYLIQCQTRGKEWTAAEVKRVAAELTRLVRTTTIRGFSPYETPLPRLTELLKAPVIGELTALSLSPDASARDDDRWAKMGRFYQESLATNPLLRRVRNLDLSPYTYHTAVEPLTAAETFDSVTRFRVGWRWAESKPVARFMEAPWVQRLQHVDIGLDGQAAEVTAAGLGKLSHLHTLEIFDTSASAAAVLAAGQFRTLARLICRKPLDVEHARALAKAKFPALVAFEAHSTGTKNDAFCELLKADWFGRLRTLSFEESPLGDRAIRALAAHPVAKNLRSLTIGEHALTPDGLMALARAFPALTTLNLWLTFKRRGTPAAVTKFLKALDAPNLRHLDLNGWQLGDDGAKALVKNRSLTKLTRLSIESGRIGDAGAKALIASPHLQNLVSLRLGGNPIRHGADALTDPDVMPQLGDLWLYFQALSKKTTKKLESRPGLYLVL